MPRLGCGAATRLVLLPGVGMRAADFVEAGFFDAVADRGLAVDLQALELVGDGLGNAQALATLEQTVLAPARAQGQRIWLAGLSLGGLLALQQAVDAPGSVDGLCLLAPYPGSRVTAHAIEQAGGLDAWTPTPAQLEDPEFRVWHWLRRPPAVPPLFLGYGTEDRFAAGLQAMARRLPESAVCTLPGDHSLPVWRQLWERFLDRRLLGA